MKFRNFISGLLCIVVVLMLVTSTAFAAPLLDTLVCQVNGLNVRTGPGTNYTSWGMLYKGDVYQAVSTQPSWYYGFATSMSYLYDTYGYCVYGYASNSASNWTAFK